MHYKGIWPIWANDFGTIEAPPPENRLYWEGLSFLESYRFDASSVEDLNLSGRFGPPQF